MIGYNRLLIESNEDHLHGLGGGAILLRFQRIALQETHPQHRP